MRLRNIRTGRTRWYIESWQPWVLGDPWHETLGDVRRNRIQKRRRLNSSLARVRDRLKKSKTKFG